MNTYVLVPILIAVLILVALIILIAVGLDKTINQEEEKEDEQ